MLYIRSFLFTVYFVSLTFFVCVTGFFVGLISQKITMRYISWWSRSIVWGARVFAGIKLDIKGLENLPKGEGYIIACKHQSAFETLIFHSFLDTPCFIFKAEMAKVPFMGGLLKAMDCIAVNRKDGTRALRYMVSESKNRLDDGKVIIIFPEGTRVAVGEHKKYSPGVAMIYDEAKVKVVPAAINSGCLWPRNSFIKKAGTITLQFLPPLPAGMDKRDMLTELEQKIEEATSVLPAPNGNEIKS